MKKTSIAINLKNKEELESLLRISGSLNIYCSTFTNTQSAIEYINQPNFNIEPYHYLYFDKKYPNKIVICRKEYFNADITEICNDVSSFINKLLELKTIIPIEVKLNGKSYCYCYKG